MAPWAWPWVPRWEDRQTDRQACEEGAEVLRGEERQENNSVFRASGHDLAWQGINALGKMDVALEYIEHVMDFTNYLY